MAERHFHHISKAMIMPRLSVTALLTTLLSFLAMAPMINAEDQQILELRTYELIDAGAELKLDAYLEQALIPALLRQGLGPIGAFGQSKGTANAKANEACQVMLLIAGPNANLVTSAASKLASDSLYKEKAREYLGTPPESPLLKRVRSELLLSFACWPQVTVPVQKKEQSDRLFELRIYESPTEKRGDLKVEMFNSEEVPIFLDSGVIPVFMGQALVGDKLPNLTYMTVYDDEASRTAAWKKFVAHPDWQVLKQAEKYEGTVSKIHKSDWVPKPYSQL